MKICLVNHKNQNDINAFSGTSYFMTRAIKEEFEEVVEYDMPESKDFDNDVSYGHFDKTLIPAGKGLSNFLRENDVRADFIVCLGGNAVVPFYEHDTPIVYWHDSTWHTFLGHYLTTKQFDEFKMKYRNFHLWDTSALEKAALAIFSSEYVAQSCIKDYKIPGDKVKVIPFGANLYAPPSPDYLRNALEIRARSPFLHLTFIGKEWYRKGLRDAYRLAARLNKTGIPTILHVICADPQVRRRFNSPFVIVHGSIEKSDKKQFELLETILRGTHFLVHPALAEPFGIVLCEANAYGIPVIGTDVEGLKTIVVNGRNGYLFPPGRFVKEASRVAKDIFEHFDTRYPSLFHSALNEFNKRLNWKAGVKELKRVLSER
jgi:glycosyltransferase involved in cell wall biosynthesis